MCKHCFQFLLGDCKSQTKSGENYVYAKFRRNNKEYYGIIEKGVEHRFFN